MQRKAGGRSCDKYVTDALVGAAADLKWEARLANTWIAHVVWCSMSRGLTARSKDVNEEIQGIRRPTAPEQALAGFMRKAGLPTI